ncbi:MULTISPECIES: lipopolysaccharide heptosyltransferase RfaC [Pasteurellaceae]|uniref:Lipopolysaccharide heptosyltransferase 1 n=1 Tax=Pasteurella atlantica TaxID=2827233 RepID=A0AAW8CLU9_9PAST|nr:lipopolysaccharide heptosyltransferase RfaC [Pasteurella atlantica]MBR0572998.1 lipopolysaccharide heptosyltransferase RfaC [Pasteurella atlantica]MDP8038875.1 lipopolysaccharide heptosyltransferase RfaC [Pasteurella atlantica]MDP8041016.1 lipopolysaccharide heptosyltransferase RfaC [Pasteurella atlantica]MDP8043152.1 lipopolysaccharide heptosyltransferase RfaC [Pasteurella atlantica]MDP8045238.1 lipopolysaccharide heptosyltransferase RfaC [Pasteurella atlantica]
MKICLVKTSSMGDVIHTLPALTDAQNAIPDLQVDWVIEQAFAEIPKWHSAVNQVIPIKIRHWRKNLFQRQTWLEWQAYKKQLQSTQYDAVIDAQGLIKSTYLVTHLAKGTKYGYDNQSAREGLSSLFYDEKFTISYQQHAVERIRQLLAKSLGYPEPTQIGDYGIADRFSVKFANSSQNVTACDPYCTSYIVAIHSTTRADKHWNENYWIEIIKAITTQHIEVHLPWGNVTEQARAERLATVSPLAKVLPKLTLTELAQHIANSQSVISVDTGLSHLTAALNKPNIILYGATDPKLIGAYGQNQHYLQADSMQNIQPSQVLDKLRTENAI